MLQNYLKIVFINFVRNNVNSIKSTKIMKKVLLNSLIFGLLLFVSNANAQKGKAPDYSGTWNYEVKDTPSGDYSGKIILVKNKKTYTGEAINKAGIKFRFDLVSMKGNQMTFSTNLENTNSTVNCTFKGNTMTANVKVAGDDFAYKMKAKRLGN